MAAAIAFYTIFSLAPVLVLAVTIGDLVLSEAQYSVRADLAAELGTLVGEEGEKAIEQVLESAGSSAPTLQAILATTITILSVP
jgi:membrane protein